MSFLGKIVTGIFGSKSKKDIKQLAPFVEDINNQFNRLEQLSDNELQAEFNQIKLNLKQTIDEKKKELKSTNIESSDLDNQLYLIEQEYLNNSMVRVFAIIKDACRRLFGKEYSVMNQPMKWEMIPYDVQLIGGVVLHKGKIAEMKTGEGKTLVSTLSIILNAITQRGVHVITVNDYLAERDSQWMGILYEFLGLSVGCILNQMDSSTRKTMYLKDITYGTNSQFGFDYLRDNMAINAENQVQRGHAYAIVDEVDSVLIDEARTPLIISGQINNNQNEKYSLWRNSIDLLIKRQKQHVNDLLGNIEELLENDQEGAGKILLMAQRGQPKNKTLINLMQKQGVKQLISKTESQYLREKKLNELDEDLYFSIDEKSNVIDLSDKGRKFLSPDDPETFVIPDLGENFHNIEKKFSNSKDINKEKEKVQALHSDRSEKIHTINQLLRAFSLFEKDVEYIVQDGKVLIVDQHTGRVMHGRQFSDGMHQAIESKEGVAIQRETQTVATITIQNYFRMYEKLSGMTGTAITEASEFMQIYKLDVVEIPTHRPIARKDHQDLIYKTRNEKYQAVIDKIKELNSEGQPILVGTTSVEESEFLAKMMKSAQIPHNVLNAKQHQREADIVARAGLKNSVTISTNMAGRGTDIKLGEGVKDLGGLYILGTGRHESRRIDLQLRGRSGRQGDNGESIFYLSLEDNLMRLFGSERIAKVMDTLGLQDGEVITHPMITKSIERAQKKIEAMNFGSRKNIIEYDDIMNYQRDIVYNRRNFALHEQNISNELEIIIEEYIDIIIAEFCSSSSSNQWEFSAFKDDVLNTFGIDLGDDINCSNNIELIEKLKQIINEALQFKDENYNSEFYNEYKKFIILKTIDQKWQDHLYMMDQLREGINLRAYGQKNPIVEYKQEGFAMFEQMMHETNKETLKRIFRVDLSKISNQNIEHSQRTSNIKTTSNKDILATNSSASQMQQNPMKNFDSSMKPQKTFAPNQKRTPIRTDNKIGRNSKVIIKKGSESKTIKYKNIDKFISQGWELS